MRVFRRGSVSQQPAGRRSSLSFYLSALLVLAVVLSGFPSSGNNHEVLAADTTVYDFVAQAGSASWFSGAGSLPFPGSDSDSRGFALHRTSAQLEDNSTWANVLETHPQWVSNGWIMGRYPQSTVPAGAELEVKVGFFNGATGTDGVTFQIQFEEGQSRQTVLTRYATYDGHLDTVSAGLGSLAGRTGHFILYVNAGQSSGRDWAAWAEARIEAAPPPPPLELPDLVVEEIACDWEKHRIGYTVRNAGESPAPSGHVAALVVESAKESEDTVPIELGPGDEYQSWFDGYAWDECRTTKVTVCADNDAAVAEEDEQNNCLSAECVCTPATAPPPPPLQCPSDCECLSKDEGYARGLEFCLDDNGAPIVCQVLDAQEEIYHYCFRRGEAAPVKPRPEPRQSDVDDDDEVNHEDVGIIATHYGGETGSSRVPWDPNADGIVDFKDLAIVGACYGKSITDEKLKDAGISTPQGLLDSVGSAEDFEALALRVDVAPEGLLRAIRKAELEKAIPGLGKHNFGLLRGINMGSLAALQSLDTEEPTVLDMLHNELRLDWIASGGKERGEPLPSPDDLANWLSSAGGVDPAITVSEDGEIKFPDGSSLPPDEEEEAVGGTRMPGEAPGVPPPSGVQPSSLVFTEGYPGMGGGVVAEGARPTVPPESIPEPCPTISGYIYGFPYDVSTLKITVERLEPRMTYDYMTGQARGIEMTAVEGKLVDVQQEFAGLSGGRITYYSTGCLSPGEWTLTPVFYGGEPETPVWHGTWDPPQQEVAVSSGLEPVTDANFAFTPIDTNAPTIDVRHSPAQPGGSDTVTFDVSIEDGHLLQKVEVYHWGRYSDGRQTEPELLTSDFWDSGYPSERSYRFELGPYRPGTPNQIHFEVAAWDYPGNPAVKVDLVRVQQLTTPPASLLGMIIPASPERYYVASIGEIVFSKDSDGTPPEGEMHCGTHGTVSESGGGTREFAQDYPYFNWVEALCDDGHPVCWPWVPVLALPEFELGSCEGYSLATTVYEGDSSFERFLRWLLNIFVDSIMMVIDAISCIIDVIAASTEMSGCADLTCDLLEMFNLVGSDLGDPEDDYMGTAAFMTTASAGFGLEGGAIAADYYAEGAADADEIDWGGMLVDGSDTEGYCGALPSIELTNPMEQGVTKFKDNNPGGEWIRVLNHVQLHETQPLGETKVKFVGATVHSDRDGLLRGKGDVYARTLVGTVGGRPATSNDHSLEADDLGQLPYSAADIHRFDCGKVSSGHSFTRDRFIFDRSFSDPDLALLYVQIGLWDDDGGCFVDNEIGVLSICWPMTRIVDMMEHPDEADARHGGPHEDDLLTVTIVHPVTLYGGEVDYELGPPENEDDDYYYIISDTREVCTRQEYIDDYTRIHFHWGSLITYEIWVNPNVREGGGSGDVGEGPTDTTGPPQSSSTGGDTPGGGAQDTGGSESTGSGPSGPPAETQTEQ